MAMAQQTVYCILWLLELKSITSVWRKLWSVHASSEQSYNSINWDGQWTVTKSVENQKMPGCPTTSSKHKEHKYTSVLPSYGRHLF
jgi:hypothetical protein